MSSRDNVDINERQLIWLISHSEGANDELMVHLTSLNNEFGRTISISRAAFGSPNPKRRNPSPPDPDQRLCAGVLVLERSGLSNPDYRTIVELLIKWVDSQPAFRLFVYLNDFHIDELRRLADTDRLVDTLFETVQIAELPSLEQLRGALVPFIRQVEHIEEAAKWAKWRLQLAKLFGSLATTVLAVAAGISVMGYPCWLFHSELHWFGSYRSQIASVVLGLLVFPIQAPIIFFLLKGMRTTALAPMQNSNFMRWFFGGWFVLVGASHLQNSLHGPHSWLLFGLASGIMVDAIRRAGRQAWRQTINVGEIKDHLVASGEQYSGMTLFGGDQFKPFSCPLLPPLSPRIFISYTRSSAKGSGLAESLYQGLRSAGVEAYLDRLSNPIGAGWKRILDHQLGACDVFICIIDEKTVHRTWVAAELLAALKANGSVGMPEIIIIIDPVFGRPPSTCPPIFQEAIRAAEAPPMQGRPQILTLNSRIVSSLIWSLAPGRFLPTSIFTRLIAMPIMSVLTILAGIGIIGLVAGLFFGFLAVLQETAKFPFTSEIDHYGWLRQVTILTAFWLGFVARYTIAFGYERENGSAAGATFPIVATAGLAFSLVCFLGNITHIVMAWSVAAGLAGWMVFASIMRSGIKPKT